MVELKNLSTGYSKDNILLSDFNYVFENRIYGILGKSGRGKTTLLRTIAGLLNPISGEVLVDGVRVDKPYKNDIYMMHQNYTSFDWLTCIDNILIAKDIKGKVTDKDYERAIKLLESVQLKEYYNMYPKQLSGGMKQRLALARTLFMDPKVILMDEPLSALDSKTREAMQDLVIDTHERLHNTVIMVTHSLEEAKRMCDVIIDL